jgi:hypothetical protein
VRVEGGGRLNLHDGFLDVEWCFGVFKLGGSLAGEMNVRCVVLVRCKNASALGDRRGLCGSSLMHVTSMDDIKSRQAYVCLRMTSRDLNTCIL